MVNNSDDEERTTPRLVPRPPLYRVWPAPICPAKVTDLNRIIQWNHSLYDLTQVKLLVQEHGILVVNHSADEAMQNKGENPLPPPAWDGGEIESLIMALTDQHFENAQWCDTSIGKHIACDSYLIYYNRSRRKAWESGIKLYVKFGYGQGTVKKTLVCRVHPANH